MKKLNIDLDEVQMAMEDILRDAFDYFLDIETGDVIILSEDIISRARSVLQESMDDDMTDYEEVIFDEEQDIPDWMEDEVELALDIFLNEPERYRRIPERSPNSGFSAMRDFASTLENVSLRNTLENALNGKGAFRGFKDALEQYPKERKLWYGFNAKSARKEIRQWLKSLDIYTEDGNAVLLDADDSSN